MKKNRLILFLLVFFLLLMSHHSLLVNAEEPFDVNKAIAAGDHRGLAEYYRSQMAAEKKAAERHDQMRREYAKSVAPHAHNLVLHCEELYLLSLKQAKTYEWLTIQEERLGAVR